MVGSAVVLTCKVTTKGHEPVAMTLFSQSSGITTKSFDDICLPSGECHRGISVLITVKPGDGNYTCQAQWENPNYNRSDIFEAKVFGRCSISISCYHVLRGLPFCTYAPRVGGWGQASYTFPLRITCKKGVGGSR